MTAQSTTQSPPNSRDYSKVRRDRIALATWQAILLELKSPEGVVVLPSQEVMDAFAMLSAMMLATSPEAAVPSKLRGLCDEHAKRIVNDTRLFRENYAASGTSPFDAVIGEEAFH